MAAIENILDNIRARLEGTGSWPPPEVRETWLKIEDYRRRYYNDHGQMLAHSPYWSRTDERREVFTPVPLARDMARLSAQLLFSETPRFTHEQMQDDLDELASENMLASHLQESGENVAVEGIGALRVFRDDEALDGVPIIEYVPGDQVVWDFRHGRFVVGGAVVVTRVVQRGATTGAEGPFAAQPNQQIGSSLTARSRAYDVYRLIEYHEPGRVSRRLYKGQHTALGSQIELSEYPEFAGLEDQEDTLEGVSTLLMWRNVPNGASDLAGLETMLDRVNDGFSIGYDKMRKSVPITFADRSLADDQGYTDLTGVVLTGDGNMEIPLGDSAVKTVETVQPGLQADDHINMVQHFVDTTLELAGYSRATWGRDDGGAADSGKALKLRQVRTLMSRAGKERMAKDAIAKALAVALTWQHGGELKDNRPEVELGDGLPDDPLETAQEIQTLKSAEAISIEEAIRRVKPGAQQEEIDEEVQRLKQENSGPEPRVPNGSPNGSPNGGLNSDALRNGLRGENREGEERG